MAIIYGPDGAFRPFGALHKQYRADLLDGTLPSWLSLDTTGTGLGASITPYTGSGGGVAISTAPIADRRATLRGPSIDLAGIEAIRLRAVVSDSHTNRIFYLGLDNGPDGAVAQQTNRASTTTIKGVAGGVATNVEAGYNMSGGGKRFPISLLLVTSDKTLAIGEGDQVWGEYTFGAAMGLGVITPTIAWRTTSTAVITGRVHQVIIDLWWR